MGLECFTLNTQPLSHCTGILQIFLKCNSFKFLKLKLVYITPEFNISYNGK